jgi:glucokinase
MTAQAPPAELPARSAIGLDIGGTKIAGGVVTGDGTVLDLIDVPTPVTGDTVETLEALRKVIDSLRDRHPGVEAVGAGAAGMVEWPSGHIRWAPNNVYTELPLRRLLAQETGLPAVVDNDANVAAWAEARHGAAAGYDHVAVLTVGTGIGAGVVLGGQLQRGHSGRGGELGHIVLAPDGPQCGCGNTGCLEAMASGTALGRAGREAAAADPGGILATLAGGPDKVTGQIVFAAAQHGDRTARELFGQIGYWLGIGIASVVNLLDIELVVIGGGMVTAGDLLLAPARESFGRFLFGRARRPLPQIVPARFGPDAGVVGAAALALDHGGLHHPALSHETAACGRPGGRMSGPALPGRNRRARPPPALLTVAGPRDRSLARCGGQRALLCRNWVTDGVVWKQVSLVPTAARWSSRSSMTTPTCVTACWPGCRRRIPRSPPGSWPQPSRSSWRGTPRRLAGRTWCCST